MHEQGGMPDEMHDLPPELYNLLANGELNPEAVRLIQAMARNPKMFKQGPAWKDILFQKAMISPGMSEGNVEY